MNLQGVISRWNGAEVSAMDVYSDIFRLGEGVIQRSDEAPGLHKANPLILGHQGGRMHRKILFEDTFEETLAEFQEMDWSILNGLTYWGRVNNSENQSKMFALIFDLDGVTPDSLDLFFRGSFYARRYPLPNYVIMSGHGVHLYYVFEVPVDLYPETKVQMKELKYQLTHRMWNCDTSEDSHIQFQGINQGFRVIGGKTKIEGVRARAFRFNTHPTDPIELYDYVLSEYKESAFKKWKPAKYTLEEASKKWPDWYDRIVLGNGVRKYWTVKPALYEWWLRKVRDEGVASFHHRYFCVMTLAIFAAKCDIDEDRLRADAFSLVPVLNKIGTEPFTEQDVESALECYDRRYCTFPREDLAHITDVSMPPNKRNGRKQNLHLKIARSNLAILNEEEGRVLQGRPAGSGTKQQLIQDYAATHPEVNHSEIARALGVSRPTVIKWLKNSESNVSDFAD